MKWLIFAGVVFLCYHVCKWVNKQFQSFLSKSPKRRPIWEWTKRIVLAALSLQLLFSTWERWYYFHDEMIYGSKYRDPSYADQIEIETYLMSQQEVAALFAGEPPNPSREEIPLTSDLYKQYPHGPTYPRFYLVTRVKNKGDKIFWGTLDCTAEGERITTVDIPPLPPQMQEFKNVVQVAEFVWQKTPPSPGMSGPYPELKTTWLCLYAKEGVRS